jgi:hypothetical protein
MYPAPPVTSTVRIGEEDDDDDDEVEDVARKFVLLPLLALLLAPPLPLLLPMAADNAMTVVIL